MVDDHQVRKDEETVPPPPQRELFLTFRGQPVPVSWVSSVTEEQAAQVLQSGPFAQWVRNCEQSRDETGTKQLELHQVEIQSVDMFGARGVGFVKIKSHCTLRSLVVDHNAVDSGVSERIEHSHRLPGICFLRGSAVTIMIALFCQDDKVDNDDQRLPSVYTLLVDQPRVPVGQVSCLELPAGMMDDETKNVAGIAVQEIQEECGIAIHADELTDLTELALTPAVQAGHLPRAAILPSPGGCDEMVRILYLEKTVTRAQLQEMDRRMTGLRDHGEVITLRVVPLAEAWKISGDAKVMLAMFLLEQLRLEGKIPPAGQLSTPLLPGTGNAELDHGPASSSSQVLPLVESAEATAEPTLTLNNGVVIPVLGFGLYMVPDTVLGEQVILDAVKAGYRHFDGASFYGNEATLGRALRSTGLFRKDFFISSKVWNDAVIGGRSSVRASVEQSMADIGFGDYLDLVLIHWPVPGHYVEAYKELELLYHEGKVRAIGISNFNPLEYECLLQAGINISPVVNQMEVSPVMFRLQLVDYFQSRGIAVAAFKPLNRAGAFDRPTIVDIAHKHSVSPAQVMLRWGIQKGLIVVAKTAAASRMRENRCVVNFSLDEDDIMHLDSMTTDAEIEEREAHEQIRKTSL